MSVENSEPDDEASMYTLEQRRSRYMGMRVAQLRQMMTERGIVPDLVGFHKVDYIERLMQDDDNIEQGLPQIAYG